MLRILTLTSIVAVAACGGDGTSAVTIESDLTGVYRLDRYVGSQAGCDTDLGTVFAPGEFVVLYGFRPPNDREEVALGGTFCADIAQCRALGRAAEQPQVGYSFVDGSDENGWQGWALLGGDVRGEQCFARMQAHQLAVVGGTPPSIRIETKTIESTNFEPSGQMGNEIECAVMDAVAALDGQPCLEILVLEASHEAGL